MTFHGNCALPRQPTHTMEIRSIRAAASGGCYAPPRPPRPPPAMSRPPLDPAFPVVARPGRASSVAAAATGATPWHLAEPRKGSGEADRHEALWPSAPTGRDAVATRWRAPPVACATSLSYLTERPPLSRPTSKPTSTPTLMPAARPMMSRPGDLPDDREANRPAAQLLQVERTATWCIYEARLRWQTPRRPTRSGTRR